MKKTDFGIKVPLKLTKTFSKQEISKNIIIMFALFFVINAQTIFCQEQDITQRIRHHVYFLSSDSLEGRGLGTKGKEIAANYIAQQFQTYGLKPFGNSFYRDFSFKEDLAWISAKNIVGYLEGNDSILKHEFILIGAHYDHLGYDITDTSKNIFYGADDNASGVAVMLEIARNLCLKSTTMKRSIIFVAFDAEESGLFGSDEFLKTYPNATASLKLTLCLDMVGSYSHNTGINLIGIGSLTKGTETAEAHAETNHVLIKKANSSIAEDTDTYHFGLSGIPSVHVFTGLHTRYHTTRDTPDKLDYKGMFKIEQYVSDLAYAFANSDTLISAIHASQKGEHTSENIQRRLSFYIFMANGTSYHNYYTTFFRANSLYTFNAGVAANYRILPYLHTQLCISYDLNSSKIAGGNFWRHSLTIPFYLQPTLQVGGNNTRFFIQTGPYFSYSFGGRNAGKPIQLGTLTQKTEFGTDIGIGFGTGKFQVAFMFRNGMTDVFMEEQVRSIRKLFLISYKI